MTMHQLAGVASAAPSGVRWLTIGMTLSLVGCGLGPFDDDDFLTLEPLPERYREIESVRFEDRSQTPPVTVEEATDDVLEGVVRPTEPAPAVRFTLEEVRAAALENNLDLKVELVSPSVAQATVDEEEAKFESAFTGSFVRSKTDSPTAVATEGTIVDFNRIDFGVRIPLRTGGTATVNFPLSRTATNNPFALLDPSYTVDLTFSLSHNLLRGAGNRVNTHSIRVVKYQSGVTQAQTKLEAIRILANADRAYWILYAVRRELEVTQQEYDRAMSQLERARRRVAAGDAADIEVLRAEAGVSQRLEAIIIADNAVRRRQRDLKRIVNIDTLPMESETAIDLATQPDPVGLDLDADALAGFAVANRMEMLQLELQLAMNASTIDFERNARLPLVVLDYTYNIGGLDFSHRDALDQVVDSSFTNWSIGLRADIPIGNEAANARVHRAILERLQRLATRDRQEQAIRQEVHDAVDQIRQDWQRILAARQNALLQGRTYEAEQRQFEVGARTSTDVLDAATELARAQSREILALTDYQIAQVDLAFATGTLLGYERVRWEPSDVPEDERR